MNKAICFFKKEAVLCVALLLAVLSACVVLPDQGYAQYLDLRTLAILFCLMCVMAGLQKIGVFGRIARGLLKRVRGLCGLVLVLMLLCFFSSMLITNDVALITFVPFTFTVLGMMDGEQRRRLALPLVARQTIAANLGSMLTPIGNPQNLYLYGRAGMSMDRFLLLMLPYAIFSLVLLMLWAVILGGSRTGGSNSRINMAVSNPGDNETDFNLRTNEYGVNLQTDDFYSNSEASEPAWKAGAGELGRQKRGAFFCGSASPALWVYLALFILCLLTVAHVLPWQAVLGMVLAAVLLTDRAILKKVDYALLFTFVGFFIFIGNVGRIPFFRDFLQAAVSGREVYAAIAASQAISNVPAALLLSGFTENYERLLIGVNLGGLGTLIASMASLISYKYVAKQESERKGAYIAVFTVSNLCFLTALVLFYMVWGYLCP